MNETIRSKQLFKKAVEIIPGGVNSPVRAFNAVGGNPVFIRNADGAYIYDMDDNKYIDYICSWGPMILGHNHPKICEAVKNSAQNGLSFGAPTELEVLLAEKILKFVPKLEMVRMVNSGTEAVMSALRLARGFTNRNKIIKFEGCYHGHYDGMLVKAGSGALTCGKPDSLGVTPDLAKDTLVAEYNNLDSVLELFESNKNQVAAVIIEPVAANMGVVVPKPSFLKDLKDLCKANGSLLIFDEVITGFRLAKGGALEYYDVDADIITYGKIIGGGMPVGAYGGRKEIMEMVSPCGGVYQAGTLSGNPIAMAAGIAQLSVLENDEIYNHINSMAKRLESGLKQIIESKNIIGKVAAEGSLVCLFLGVQKAENFKEIYALDREIYGKYFRKMLQNGIYLAPSQFEAMFVSNAHSQEIIDETLNVAESALKAF